MPEADPRSDQALVAAGNRGDAAALEALYYRYRDWVVALAFRLTADREDALDVLQETFAYLFGKFRGLQSPGFELRAQLKTFLYPVVQNLSFGRIRKRKDVRSLEDVGADVPAAVEPDAMDLRALLEALAPAEREVLLLRFVDGLALREIAEALGVPLGTVKSRLHNALSTLRQDPRAKNHLAP